MDVFANENNLEENYSIREKCLSSEEIKRLSIQETRKVSEYTAGLLELNSKKHWDLFYKRNETRFFKDRHWTTREFRDLLNQDDQSSRILFEIGCGVGNFIFPLLEEKLNFRVIACDLSPRAIEIVKNNPKYDSETMQVFQCDITTEEVFSRVRETSVDIVTLIFVLSAIHPDNFLTTLKTVHRLLKPGGVVLFRDYGLYDMAQLRFKAGHKISENFYMRLDGTRSYYFSTDCLEKLFLAAGFEVIFNAYVHRRTVNKKENLDVPRIFAQSKVRKV